MPWFDLMNVEMETRQQSCPNHIAFIRYDLHGRQGWSILMSYNRISRICQVTLISVQVSKVNVIIKMKGLRMSLIVPSS